MKKKMMAHLRHEWFLWIGGACFLVGSLVAGSVGLASSATTGTTTTGTTTMGPTVNQGAPGSSPWPVTTNGNVGLSGSLPAGSNNIGNVGLSGSLPAGSNDIGTVHVATPPSTAGSQHCRVPDFSYFCETDSPVIAAGSMVNTLSVECDTAQGHHVDVSYFDAGSGFKIAVPLTFQDTLSNGDDRYSGTLTNLGIQDTGNFDVNQDYAGSSLNGSICTMSYVETNS
jgi:hypothetical protein